MQLYVFQFLKTANEIIYIEVNMQKCFINTVCFLISLYCTRKVCLKSCKDSIDLIQLSNCLTMWFVLLFVIFWWYSWKWIKVNRNRIWIDLKYIVKRKSHVMCLTHRRIIKHNILHWKMPLWCENSPSTYNLMRMI